MERLTFASHANEPPVKTLPLGGKMFEEPGFSSVLYPPKLTHSLNSLTPTQAVARS